MAHTLPAKAQKTHTPRLVLSNPSGQDTFAELMVHTKRHQWAQRVKRLLYTRSQVSPGLSRFVIDAEIEPYRVFYRQHAAQQAGGDAEMLTWFNGQPE